MSHYRGAPAGAFGHKKALLPIADHVARTIWAPPMCGSAPLAKAEHQLKVTGVKDYEIRHVSMQLWKRVSESYKICGPNVSGPIDRLVGALEKANRRG